MSTFDDDVFEYEGGMRQCIGNFGNNLVSDLSDRIVELTPDDPDYDEDYSARKHLEWGVGELVRWCRGLNRKAHEAIQERDAARDENAKTQVKLMFEDEKRTVAKLLDEHGVADIDLWDMLIKERDKLAARVKELEASPPA